MPKRTAVVAKARVELPVDIQAQYDAEVAALKTKLSAPTGNRILISQSKTFKLPNGNETPGPISAIVLAFTSLNLYYDTAFDRNNITPPKCYALGEVPTALVPFADSLDRQGETCAGCWANQWKTGPNNKGKACNNHRLLAVIMADSTPEDPIYLLRLSPTATTAFDEYARSIGDVFKKPIRTVLSEIGFDPNSQYSTVRFGKPTPLSVEQEVMANQRFAAATQLLATKPEFSVIEVAKKPVTKGASKRAPQ